MRFELFFCLFVASLTSGAPIEDETVAFSVPQTIKDAGYPVEEHFVQTSDGYILAVHRIPYGKNGKLIKDRPVVFLQHGLLCSSSDWILLGPGQALGYILADAGYDVWMGNARGNTFSRNHSWITPDAKGFWDFSWHEIGMIDLPNMIDYALKETGQEKLQYVGHSQGTTGFFVMTSLRPEYNKKITSMHALAPVAYLGKAKSPVLRILAPLLNNLVKVFKLIGQNEFMPSSDLTQGAAQDLCKDGSWLQELCANILFIIAGFDSANLNRTMIPDIMKTTPAGASVNQVIHYTQNHKSRKFRMFDYGKIKNLVKYGSFSPPAYDLKKVTVPVTLYYGDNDWLAAVEDVLQIAVELGNLEGLYRVPHDKWNHLDYLWAIHVKTLLYDRVLADIIRFA